MQWISSRSVFLHVVMVKRGVKYLDLFLQFPTGLSVYERRSSFLRIWENLKIIFLKAPHAIELFDLLISSGQ